MSTTTLATTVLGSSRLLESGRLRGKRVGIVANPASIDQQFVHVVDRLVRADGVTLGAIFGPQHGFNADLQENMIETPHAESRAHRVKVYSLYSETREPTPAMLDGLDVLVVDLQDVGTRIYTFIYTMAYCLTGAAKAGIPVIVCDRPNPIGGVGGRRADARAGLRVVRRALPHPDAARVDHRRAGPPVQRRLRARRRPHGRADERLVAPDVLGRHRRAVGAPVAQHADAGDGHRLPGAGALRGHDAVRGARHDPAVRAVRGAGARRRTRWPRR